jgi:hypothetical protein
LLQQIARALADQKSFAGLERVEDADDKIAKAKQSVAALNTYLGQKDEELESERDRIAARQRAAEVLERNVRSKVDLSQLEERLNQLAMRIGTQEAGYEFQKWFYDLMDHFDVDNRRPYSNSGRQIDGSVTIDGTTYVVELKFTQQAAVATDIDSLLAKVNSKADNTMGIMVSMSGFTSIAVDQASFPKTPLLLFDYQHLYNLVLNGLESFPDTVRRVRRHSSQTGRAHLAVADFGRP